MNEVRDNRFSKTPAVAVVNFGCAKNTVDAETMLGILKDHDVPITSNLEEAEIIVLNTCGFLKDARDEATAFAKACQSYRRQGSLKRLVVTGCMADRDRHWFNVPGIDVDVFMSPFKLRDILDFLGLQKKSINRGYPGGESSEGRLPRMLSTPPSYGYLKISDGCDNRCSFCRIPYLRGSFRSRPLNEVVHDAEMIARQARKEIVLVSQDTASYGKDLTSRIDLPVLVRALSEAGRVPWIRVMYVNPIHFQTHWISILRDIPGWCRYLDIPVQHLDDNVLKLMNRKMTGDAIEAMMEKLLEMMPDLTLRTTLMVGFPGEDESAFRKLKSFVKKGFIRHLGVFIYSPEPDTAAFRYPNPVDPVRALARREELMILQQEVSEAFNRRLVGTRQTVLVDTSDESGSAARLECQAPEADGIVNIPYQSAPGTFLEVEIQRAGPYDLWAVPVNGERRMSSKGVMKNESET